MLLWTSILLSSDDGPGGGFVSVPLDPDRTASGYALSEDRTQIENVSSDSDYRAFALAVEGAVIEPAITDKVYWEIDCAGGAAEYSGYLGIVTEAEWGAFDSNNNPISGPSVGYRGNGMIWSNSAGPVSGLLTYGAGDTVMICYRPSTSEFWCGVNGVWNHDPDTDPATFIPSVTGTRFLVSLQGRGIGDSARLVSRPEDFTYSMPAGAVSLAEIYTPPAPSVELSQTSITAVLAQPPGQQSVSQIAITAVLAQPPGQQSVSQMAITAVIAPV